VLSQPLVLAIHCGKNPAPPPHLLKQQVVQVGVSQQSTLPFFSFSIYSYVHTMFRSFLPPPFNVSGAQWGVEHPAWSSGVKGRAKQCEWELCFGMGGVRKAQHKA
jgi:hypothetical protein